MASRRRIRLLIRVLLYLGVIAVLFLKRDQLPWRQYRDRITGAGDDTALIISGRDLAPALIDRLVAGYQREYPDLMVTLAGGGTNQALEDLINGRVDAAFLYRPPTPQEQDLFREVDGDTAVVVPVAVGALLLLAGTQIDEESTTLAVLKARLDGTHEVPGGPFYAPDPNEGAWPAARQSLGISEHQASLIFLADAGAVIDAVRVAPDARGLVSSLNAPLDLEQSVTAGVKVLRLAAGDEEAAAPTYENVATGVYPLHHHLYVACRPSGGIQGTKFVTHLASARGLRQVERAGVVPAKQVLREIYLTRDPVGE